MPLSISVISESLCKVPICRFESRVWSHWADSNGEKYVISLADIPTVYAYFTGSFSGGGGPKNPPPSFSEFGRGHHNPRPWPKGPFERECVAYTHQIRYPLNLVPSILHLEDRDVCVAFPQQSGACFHFNFSMRE